MSVASGYPPSVTNAAAIGMPPVAAITGGVPSTQYVDVSGQVPSFPSTDRLERGTFKVVVGSWRRINPATTPTNDYTVNVSEYVPKTTPVTRVQLVDVDIPLTQQLIEPLWSRLYFGQGIYTSNDCRRLSVTVREPDYAVTADVVLPLLLNQVRTYQLLSASSTVRFFMTAQAPSPIVPIAEAWHQLSLIHCGSMRLVGLPAPLEEFVLTSDIVRDDTSMSFDVISPVLYAALPDPATVSAPCMPFLYASPIPGPSYLSRIVAKTMSVALAQTLPPVPKSCESSFGHWQFVTNYDPMDDRYSLTMQAPLGAAGDQEDVTILLAGSVVDYMGFGSNLQLAVPKHDKLQLRAQNHRFQLPTSYAAVQTGNPRAGEELATWVQTALNAYDWGSGFSFRILYPGAGAWVDVVVPGGHMTLNQLATAVTTALATAGVSVEAVYVDSTEGAKSGLYFGPLAGSPANAFQLDLTFDPDFNPARIGYDSKIYPACVEHFPTRNACHIPLLSAVCGMETDCFSPMSDVCVTYREDADQLVFETVPFEPFTAVLTIEDSCDATTTRYRVTTAALDNTRHGFRIGAQVIVTSDGTDQRFGYVSDIVSDEEFIMARSDNNTADVPAGEVTVIPQDKMPLDLYLQRIYAIQDPKKTTPDALSFRLNGIGAEMLGFQPRTYETCRELVSPGTIDLNQDPYILICLGFGGTEGIPATGDVYYPFVAKGSSQLVFAKIVRAALFRADFDKVFDHSFVGAGMPLGYITLRVLNPNGTPYQTHGHPTSIALRFDTRQSYVGLGGGHVSVTYPPAPPRPPAGPRRPPAGYPPHGLAPVGGTRASAMIPHARQMRAPAPVRGGHHGPR